MLWIRSIGLNADPDPAFCLSSDRDPDPGSQPNEDPCGSRSGSWSDLAVKKVEFLHVNILYAGNRP
jgi:hypothetical protein